MKRDYLIQNVGNTRGHFSKKENRAAKLLDMWSDLETKMIGMIKRGNGKSESARHAYGVLLMMETGIRIGNESSAEGWVCDFEILAKEDGEYKSGDKKGKKFRKGDVIYQHPLFGQHVRTYGLTSLLHSHVTKRTTFIEVSFTGKKHVAQDLEVRHPVLYRYMPTGSPEELFLGITKHSLTKFIKRYVGRQFKPKDLRTACVNLQFINRFSRDPLASDFAEAPTKGARKKVLALAIEQTAEQIGHTKGVCKSAYLSSPLLRLIADAAVNPDNYKWS